jgi:hypothetical protein
MSDNPERNTKTEITGCCHLLVYIAVFVNFSKGMTGYSNLAVSYSSQVIASLLRASLPRPSALQAGQHLGYS